MRKSPLYFSDHPLARFRFEAAHLIARFGSRIKACKTEGVQSFSFVAKIRSIITIAVVPLHRNIRHRGTLPERYGKRGRPRRTNQWLIKKTILSKSRQSKRRGTRLSRWTVAPSFADHLSRLFVNQGSPGSVGIPFVIRQQAEELWQASITSL